MTLIPDSASPKALVDDKVSSDGVPISELQVNNPEDDDEDVEFGGRQARLELERKLLWKLDCRMSIMIIIYILNYARLSLYPLVL